MEKKRKFLGEILIEKGLITEADLNSAFQEQKRTKDFLGNILIGRKLIEEKDLLGALSEQFGVSYVNIEDEEIDWNVTMQFSTSLIIDHRCFPLKEDDDTVTVAVVNPLDALVISKSKDEIGAREPKLVLICKDDMDKIIKKYRKRTMFQNMKHFGSKDEDSREDNLEGNQIL